MNRFCLYLLVLAALVASCSGTSASAAADAEGLDEATEAPAEDADRSTAPQEDPGDPDSEIPPVRYVPGVQPGTADAYADMIARLEADIPVEFRNQVPWPDLRNPDPVVAQVQIFDLWIWMRSTYPDPALVEVMAADDSPSLDEILGVFSRLDGARQLEKHTGAGYRAYDHEVVTFESSGLPLWLARGVPADAVVVYYTDDSGPIQVTDRDTGEVLDSYPGTAPRDWLSIMVPTDVGWRLWRDQLLDPSDPALDFPDLPPLPGDTDQRPAPQL